MRTITEKEANELFGDLVPEDMPKDLLDMIDCYVGRTFGLEVVQVKFDGDAIVWFLHPRPSPF
jgi:hypothetical protein